VLWPLFPVRVYTGGLFPDERFESFYTIALVETVLPAPGQSGNGEWRLEVVACSRTPREEEHRR
jgi:hypothetical protein